MNALKTSNGVVVSSSGNAIINGTSLEFDNLTNKPKYNNVEMSSETNIPEIKAATWDLAYDHSQATGNPHGTTLGNLGVTATASELNVLDGITASTTELNYVDGVTSGIQGQIDSHSTEITNLQRDAHTHSNKSILDDITQAIVNGWNTASTWVSTNGASVLSRLTALETPPEIYTATLNTGVTGSVRYCKFGNMVYVQIFNLKLTVNANSYNRVATLPEGYRPSNGINTIITAPDGEYTLGDFKYKLVVGTNGVMYLLSDVASAYGAKAFGGNFGYFVE